MRYNIVALEREYASGGLEIGEKLAARLGIPCYGKEILERAAKRLGVSAGELQYLEEHMTGSLLFSLNMFASYTSGEGADLTKTQKLALTESEIIKELALEPCVIVGRSAAGLLKNHDKVLKVFINADIGDRINRACHTYGADPQHAESILRRSDKRRSGYFRTVTGSDWRDPGIYHMILNSAKLGIDAIVEILYQSINDRAL